MSGADWELRVAVANLTKSAPFCLSPLCKQLENEPHITLMTQVHVAYATTPQWPVCLSIMDMVQ